MKKALVAALALVAAAGCTSVESTVVNKDDVAANGGDAVAVLQANALGLSLLFHTFDIVPADLDVVVNRVLVTEAKAIGASRVDLKNAQALPKHGIFRIVTCPGVILCPTVAGATGVAVK
jgi:hypothetical protein